MPFFVFRDRSNSSILPLLIRAIVIVARTSEFLILVLQEDIERHDDHHNSAASTL